MSTTFCGEFKLPPKSEALTSLDDKIYVVTDRGLSIHHYEAPYARYSNILFPPPELSTVYPAYNFDQRSYIDVCNQTKCVYVAKRNDGRVWKLTTPDHNLKVWMPYIGNLCCLSVGSNGNVLILKLDTPEQDTEYCLEIYTKDALLANYINLTFSFPSDNVPWSALEICPGSFAFLFPRGLIVDSVNFATQTVNPNRIRYLHNGWVQSIIPGMALYSTSRVIVSSWRQLAIFDSQLNVEVIMSNFNADPFHYRKDKRQVMACQRSRANVSAHIYALQYEGEDFFADDV